MKTVFGANCHIADHSFRKLAYILRTLFIFVLVNHSVLEATTIVAHRGTSADAPENTLSAFNLAWEMGADAIEGNFRLTSDNRVICFHDATTERVTNEDLVISETRWDVLKDLEVKVEKRTSSGVARIPLLEEVLETVPVGKGIVIEIKSDKRIVSFLLEVLAASSIGMEQVFVISFDSEVLTEVKRLEPTLKTGFLIKRTLRGLSLKPSLASMVKDAKAIGCEAISVNAHPTMGLDLAEKLRGHGFELHVWTVDSPKWAKILAKSGVHSITTNRPDVILHRFGRLTQSQTQ